MFRAKDVSPPELFRIRSFRPWYFWSRAFRFLPFWTRTFRSWYFGPGRFVPWDIGRGRFAPVLFGLGRSASRTLRHGSFWTYMFRNRTFHPYILVQDVSSPDNCVIIIYIKYIFQLKVRSFRGIYFKLKLTLLRNPCDIMALRQGLCDITWGDINMLATLYNYWLLLRWTWTVIEQETSYWLTRSGGQYELITVQ